ncbi:MAG TPA: arsenosugar biosynthesis radical SAM (seleno)protein ArsS [Candidatus Binatia bacterium]|nr:arsenosugar biosynthesis radical SAM (seleno)protein ArsS [Candidatus Binatia bacterium]
MGSKAGVEGAVRPRAPGGAEAAPEFAATLAAHGAGALRRSRTTTVQVNVGKRCNQACHHCHVEAGPTRTEAMDARVVDRVLALVAASPDVALVDVTGGAPELNLHFRRLVTEARRLGRRVIDRCNLTVLFEPGMEDLAPFLAANGVEVVASLPCWGAENVEKQRGRGVFEKSIAALRDLNALGYAQPGSGLVLDLVYNPVGAFLPPPQATLEARYREELRARFGIEFRRLLTITNMPIRRFADALRRAGELGAYLGLLVNHFNPATVPGLMCRSLVSIGWDGRLYDCDFNQMLELPLGGGPRTVWEVDDVGALAERPIATAAHCFGCTAGAGSSCGGALD